MNKIIFEKRFSYLDISGILIIIKIIDHILK